MINLIEWLYLKQKDNLVYYDSLTNIHSRTYYDRILKKKYISKDCIEHNLIVVSNSLEIENPLQKYHSSMYNDDKLKIINLQVPIVMGIIRR